MSRLRPPKKPVRNGNERADVATRFAPGNKAAVGHGGRATKLARLKDVMLEHLEEDDWHLIMTAMKEKAIAGDVAAATWVRDTAGLKPKDEIVTHDVTVFELLGIPHEPE